MVVSSTTLKTSKKMFKKKNLSDIRFWVFIVAVATFIFCLSTGEPDQKIIQATSKANISFKGVALGFGVILFCLFGLVVTNAFPKEFNQHYK